MERIKEFLSQYIHRKGITTFLDSSLPALGNSINGYIDSNDNKKEAVFEVMVVLKRMFK